MSAKKSKKEKTDWSMKDLNEIEQKNVLGFFGLLLKVDKRVNPHLYERNRNTNNANQAE
jgi:hypothetical protein